MRLNTHRLQPVLNSTNDRQCHMLHGFDGLCHIRQATLCIAGEMVLKNTGLGYTVIRAGPLLEEPGGYKALIFDQVRHIVHLQQCKTDNTANFYPDIVLALLARAACSLA